MVHLQGLLEAVDRRGAVTEDPAGVVDQDVDGIDLLVDARGERPHLAQIGEVRCEGGTVQLRPDPAGLLG